MKFLSILFTLLLLSLPVKAYELLMFSHSPCGFCRAFLEEVAPTYKDSEYAEQFPLIIISVDDYPLHVPEWFVTAYEKGDIKPINATPTFILWDEKQKVEIDRLVGYFGKEWFYDRIEYKTYDLIDTTLHK